MIERTRSPQVEAFTHDEELVQALAAEIAELDARRAELVAARDEALRAAAKNHAPAAHLARLAGITRARASQIIRKD